MSKGSALSCIHAIKFVDGMLSQTIKVSCIGCKHPEKCRIAANMAPIGWLAGERVRTACGATQTIYSKPGSGVLGAWSENEFRWNKCEVRNTLASIGWNVGDITEPDQRISQAAMEGWASLVDAYGQQELAPVAAAA